ncbi:MAG TPA: hypothetical protein PKA60_01065 [Candidatus Paceibacterota bacterium]|nr:hypothetical protein [Candidatus Paceibacterota bacterium]
MRLKDFFILSILTIAFLVNPVELNSQIPGFSATEQFSINTDTRNPSPNQTVGVSVVSYQIDLKKQNIRWFLNGVSQGDGIGMTHTSIKIGGIGSTNNIRAVVTLQDGGSIEKTISIKPFNLDILAEADTYVPPFYKGKALASNQSNYRFIAVPEFFNANGTRIPNSQIVFNWKIGDRNDLANSGPGKDVYFYINDIISRPVHVTLEASPINSTESVSTSRIFGFTNPKIVFYEESPLFGTILERAMTDEIILFSKEIQIKAEKYFFDRNSMNSLTNEWVLNSKKNDALKNDLITFRRVDDKPGQINISARIYNPAKLNQFSSNNFVMTFLENR